jgi:hypothetical protein
MKKNCTNRVLIRYVDCQIRGDKKWRGIFG